MKPLWKNKHIASLLIFVLIGVLSILLSGFDMLNSWQNKLTNGLFTPQEVREDIVIVAIDEKSINADKSKGIVITERNNLMQVFENIIEFEPRVLAVDYVFRKPSTGITDTKLSQIGEMIVEESLDVSGIARELVKYKAENHPTDVELSNQLEEANNLIMGIFPSDVKEIQNGVFDGEFTQSIPLMQNNADVSASIALEIDPHDSLARKYFTTFETEDGEVIESFAVAAARLAGNSHVDNIPTIDNNNRMYINYFGLPRSFTQISAIDIYEGKITREQIEDKIVLFGPTSIVFNDLEHTPIAPKAQMAGVEIHANALQTILDGKFLTDVPLLMNIGIILAVTGLAVMMCMRFAIRTSICGIAALTLAYYFGNKIAFDQGIILDQIYPYVSILLVLITTYIYKFFTESKEKAFVSDAFGAYVSPEVLEQITKDPTKLALGGEEKIVTVLFTDIAHFTTISEKLSANGTVSLLNEFFSAMSDIIIRNGGTVDKFEGDGIMAVFGAPLPDQNHAGLACQAALHMQAKLAELRTKWKAEGKPELHIRIGINSGPVVAGNVGSAERFDYTVMGDTVNLGSRLEGANKYYGTSIMIGTQTKTLIENSPAKEHFTMRLLDKLKVKGKNFAVEVHELIGFTHQTTHPQKFIETFEQAMQLYFTRKFQDALTLFETCLTLKTQDAPSAMMIERCHTYIQTPPEQNWDGTFTLEYK